MGHYEMLFPSAAATPVRDPPCWPLPSAQDVALSSIELDFYLCIIRYLTRPATLSSSTSRATTRANPSSTQESDAPSSASTPSVHPPATPSASSSGVPEAAPTVLFDLFAEHIGRVIICLERACFLNLSQGQSTRDDHLGTIAAAARGCHPKTGAAFSDAKFLRRHAVETSRGCGGAHVSV